MEVSIVKNLLYIVGLRISDICTAYDAELQKIMTADQFKSYQEDQKKFREKRHKRHHKGE